MFDPHVIPEQCAKTKRLHSKKSWLVFKGHSRHLPIMGPLKMVSFPYYSHTNSHIFRDSYGSGMGIVWGARGPSTENATDVSVPES